MIFKKLTLHNFGLYRGRQEIDLAPPAPNKPIILFGGLNGGGKTTFLNALLLVLYGKNARCSNRGNEAYETYLSKSINREVASSEGAAVELTFDHFVDGRREELLVSRCWRATSKSVSESVEVRRDGQLDPFTTEHWNEYIEELIPSRLARLFFFDGEKIESLADPESAAEFIRTGIHDLLGLDLVSTLISDLKILERRVQASEAPSTIGEALTTQEAVISEYSDKRAALVQQCAELQNEIDKRRRSDHELKAEYRRMGGELLDKRDEFQRDLEKAELELFHIEDALRDEASGPAPLLLIRDLLASATEQALREKEAEEARAVLLTLTTRDADLLHKLQDWGAEKQCLSQLEAHLSTDRDNRGSATQVEKIVKVDPASLAMASDEQLDAIGSRIQALLNRHSHITEVITRAQRQMIAIPDPEGLEGISVSLSKIEASLIKIEHERDLVEREIGTISVRLERENTLLERIREDHVKTAFAEERSALLMQAGHRCRDHLEDFRGRLAKKNVHRVSSLILDCFNQLMRKSTLVNSIEVDPDTYNLRLLDYRGRDLPSERLSAGERQLLAISILWALARAAGRPIPTVVDTPLGRLDGIHRRHLVDRYFPFAAHQVILLSTDEEINDDLYESLAPWIGHEYMLSYDDDSQMSSVTPGYDFRGAA